LRVPFVKMSGAGNDFVVLEHDRISSLDEDALGRLASDLCRRRVSVGADGLVMVQSTGPGRARMIYFNADGSRAGMCGNAGRCASRYAFRKGWGEGKLVLDADDGPHLAEPAGNGVRLGMRDPQVLNPEVCLEHGGRSFSGMSIDTGVPHIVLWVEDVDGVDVFGAGRAFRFAGEFQPRGTNVNFVEVSGSSALRLRTYERGVEAETLACGTGAVAAAIAAHLEKGLASPVSLQARGGDLTVSFRSGGRTTGDVFLEGDARIVYEGEIEVSDLLHIGDEK